MIPHLEFVFFSFAPVGANLVTDNCHVGFKVFDFCDSANFEDTSIFRHGRSQLLVANPGAREYRSFLDGYRAVSSERAARMGDGCG
ncbi:hypothetical protein B0H16DRAFT_1540824 [Mycena metata]|uniref:Uncharacterized protein n=1 Tax=Mycena metata TaxID=1033252 RepID=A0AAD7J3X3_9AGAR|nr:hypothetical protein B0H16DRAFT_1540824 [Mycena metata]